MHALGVLANALRGGPQGGLDGLDHFSSLGRGASQTPKEPGVVLPVSDYLLQGQGLLVRFSLDPMDPLCCLAHCEVDLVHGSLDIVALLGEVLQSDVHACCGGLPAPHLGQEESQ